VATQWHEQRSSKLHMSKGVYSGRLIIALTIFFLVTLGTIFGVVNSHESGAIIPIVLSIVFATLGAVFVLFQLFLPLSSSAGATLPFIHLKSPRSEEDISRRILELPPTDPRTIGQRQRAVQEVYAELSQPDLSAIVLTGIGGVGKSTLAALVYAYAEEQRLTGNGPFAAEALWVRVDATCTMADLAATLFKALKRSVPDFGNLAPSDLALVLFQALNTPGVPRLVVFDQFENLLDLHTGQALQNQPGVDEWIDVLNNKQSTCRVLLTSRVWPRGKYGNPITHMREYYVKGLEVADGVDLLRNQGVKGTNAELQVAVEQCGGHPLALLLLSSLLRDYHLSLTAFFKDRIYEEFWIGDIARNILDHIYTKQLDQFQRDLLLAFSVYREPVSLDVAQKLMPNIERKHISQALDMLLFQHLLQAMGEGQYQTHAIVASYAQGHFDEKSEQGNQEALRVLHVKAAQHYLSQAKMSCPTRKQRRGRGDVRPLLEATWHLCQAEQWQMAFDLMRQEGLFDDLKRWGENATLHELCRLMLPLTKLLPKSPQTICIYNYLGRVHRTFGQRDLALDYLEKALLICQEIGDRKEEGAMHSFLGSVYADLGQKAEALEQFDLALSIRRTIGDREGEGWTLNNLGRIYDDLGREELALDYLEESLQIRKEVGDRRGEGRTLNTLGRIYDNLGQKERAHTCYRQALTICQEIGDRVGEGLTLNYLGLFHADRGEYHRALDYFEQALEIRRDALDRGGEGRTLNNLGRVYRILGRLEEAQSYLEEALNVCVEIGDRVGEGKVLNNLGIVYSNQKLKEQALRYLEQALSISREVEDRSGEAWALHNLGRVCADLSEYQQAWEHYKQALYIRREVGERRGEGWTLHNIGVFFLAHNDFEIALAFLLLAKNIFKDVQSPDSDTAQRNIDKLHEALGDKNRFTVLVEQVEPQAQHIVELALGEGT
jgi:tetratricopeptide (TPR) repeat protein